VPLVNFSLKKSPDFYIWFSLCDQIQLNLPWDDWHFFFAPYLSMKEGCLFVCFVCHVEISQNVVPLAILLVLL
jgi:hypothetical protein